MPIGTGFATCHRVPAPPPAPCVLVIDDEDSIREVLSDFLVSRGYQVVEAATAVGGLSVARERQPDVVLLDLNLPGAISGADALRALARTTPVVVVSGTQDAQLARDTLALGAFDYVTKPFDLDRVADVVAAAIVHGGGSGEPRR